ncbi:unnamed protein product [Symbiodinium microadriaticum]|nr:unnamed protein product [Symbiodinium microadriaticum]
MAVHVSLLSGRTVSVPWSEELNIKSLMRWAGEELGVPIGSVCKEDGSSVLKLEDSLKEAGLQNGDILYATVGQARLLSIRHLPAFVLISADRTARFLGEPLQGGPLLNHILHDVEDVSFTTGAAAVLRSDESVRTYGARDVGGLGPAGLVNVKQVSATFGAFAAVKGDGSVVAWGNPDDGGDCREVSRQLRDVDRLYSAGQSFAAVLRNGSVVTWGDESGGGSGDSSDVQHLLHDPVHMAGTRGAFAALLSDGSVVCWGDSDCGGDCSRVQQQLWNVTQLCGTDGAFAALRADGHVVAWGESSAGGVAGGAQPKLRNVVQLQASDSAFAALLYDGTVVTWGSPSHGGDSRRVQHELQGVRALCASSAAFAALRQDGFVVTWGKLQMPIIGEVASVSGAAGRFALLLLDGRLLGCQEKNTCNWVPLDALEAVVPSPLLRFRGLRGPFGLQ